MDEVLKIDVNSFIVKNVPSEEAADHNRWP